MIVCGVDFSKASHRAAHIAASLARRTHAKLELVHVREDAPGDAPTVADDVELSLLPGKQSSLLAQELVGAHPGLSVATRLAQGRPHAVLSERVREVRAEVLVIGEVGAGGRAGEMGGVAERCLLDATCPVLLVRGVEGELDARLASGEPLRLCLALDATHASDVAIAEVRRLRAQLDFDLDVVQLYWPPAERERLGLPPATDVLTGDQRIADAIGAEIEHRLGALPGRGKVTTHVLPSWGPLDDALAECAHQFHADLLVVGSHQRAGLRRILRGSVSRGLMSASRVPLLVVPTAAEAPAMQRPVKRHTRVLAAVDFSPDSVAALAHAYGALASHGRVELVHVIETTRLRPSTDELSAHEDAELRRRLEGLVPDEAVRDGFTTRVHVIVASDAAQGISHMAERLDVDLICLASHGRGALSRALLGSTARDVVTQARRPVLLVRGRSD